MANPSSALVDVLDRSALAAVVSVGKPVSALAPVHDRSAAEDPKNFHILSSSIYIYRGRLDG
jgi:hypothetical protein